MFPRRSVVESFIPLVDTLDGDALHSDDLKGQFLDLKVIQIPKKTDKACTVCNSQNID